MTSLGWRGIVIVGLLAVCFAAAFIDIADEGWPLLPHAAIMAGVWVALPGFIAAVWVYSVAATEAPKVNFLLATMFISGYLTLYILYAANGRSDPTGAGHIHVFAAPVVFSPTVLVAWAVMAWRLGRYEAAGIPDDVVEG